jgi:hypothetical protein
MEGRVYCSLKQIPNNARSSGATVKSTYLSYKLYISLRTRGFVAHLKVPDDLNTRKYDSHIDAFVKDERIYSSFGEWWFYPVNNIRSIIPVDAIFITPDNEKIEEILKVYDEVEKREKKGRITYSVHRMLAIGSETTAQVNPDILFLKCKLAELCEDILFNNNPLF